MKEFLTVLKRSKLFVGFEDQEILSVVQCLDGRVKDYAKGEFVCSNGDTAEFVGIVLNGELEIQNTDFNGCINIICKLFSSELIAAAVAYSSLRTFPFDVLAADSTQVLCLNTKCLIHPCSMLCDKHFRLIENMLRVIADRNIELSTKIDILTKRSIREKIFAFLYSQALSHNSKRFTIALSRRQMADFLSVDRSALSRELCKMRDDNLIVFDDNYFDLLYLSDNHFLPL